MGTSSTKSPYDIILVPDILSLLGIVLNNDQGTINWDGTDIPMKKPGKLQDDAICEAIYFVANTQPPLLQDLEERQQRILDADYSKVDIDALVDTLAISLKSKQ